MKCLLGFFVLLSLASCNDKTAQPAAATPVRPVLIPKDSTIGRRDSINPYAPIDVSPMDMSYFPVDYPIQHMSKSGTDLPLARVIYSRPHRQGRRIFGSLLRYGQAWRLGANEATEIEFFKNVTIQNKSVSKGRYIIYTIPYQDKWTIIFNSNLFTWGLKPDPKRDLFSFDIPIQITPQPVEYYSMVFQATETGADLVMAWDTVVTRLAIQF
jgi:hypothetical protein